MDIYHAVNGREAVAMCGEQKNDIVIMDISMPEMNGVMAAKYIRKMDDECSIIFLSAYMTLNMQEMQLKSGLWIIC